MVEPTAIIAQDSTLMTYAWLVILIPFITGAVLILLRALELRKSINQDEDYKLNEKLTGGLGVAGLFGSLVFSLLIAFRYFKQYTDLKEGHIENVQGEFDFIPTFGGAFKWGILINPLSVIMMVLLAVIAFLIHFYAVGYMHGDSGFTRFFGTMNFFTGSMFGFVLASNLFMGFIFWELLGFSSYLLIGYYWFKRSASSAAKKAFLYNKVGDVSFMIGIALIWAITLDKIGNPTLNYMELKNLVLSHELGLADLWLPGLLIFGGAIGKSAQVPLLGWLPEAMEGPTPVSSLLHSSTMVKAGLFLTARIFFMFYELGEQVSIVAEAALTPNVIAWIGTLTALAGGMIAITATDIKKVLAFSTISQLGYIGLALGAGGLAPSFYHLISHATFKSLLFLCAGSVIHAVHSQEMADMGGLKDKMPITFWTMAIGLVALAGFPFSSGFWSKDAVLLALKKSEITGAFFLYIIAVITAGITAFYSTKLLVLTFLGEPRWEKHHEDDKHVEEGHEDSMESGMMMAIPLAALGLLVLIESVWWTIGTLSHAEGILNFEYSLGTYLGVHGGEFHWVDALPSMLAVFVGIGLAWYMYAENKLESFRTSGPIQRVHAIADNRFGLDQLIYGIAEGPVMVIGDMFSSFDKDVIDGIIIDSVVAGGSLQVAQMSDEFDMGIIDGFVNYVGDTARSFGRRFRSLQTGQAPWYARLMGYGLALALTVFTITYTLNLLTF